MKDHGGNFPGTYSEIRSLKGIGDYTAAAIGSICFNLTYPVMDGNVLRFISRLSGITGSIDLPAIKKKILELAINQIDHRNPGDFNQAMMEFGAMVCTPSNPDCLNCPFRKKCIAFKNNTVDEIPVRNTKTTVRHRYIHYLVLTINNHGKEYIYLNKRTGNDIWKNLYDFPCIERSPDKNKDHLSEDEFNFLLSSASPKFQEASGQFVHLLTHQQLHARFYRFHSDKMINLPYVLVPLKDVHKYPIPKLIDRYLSENFKVQ